MKKAYIIVIILIALALGAILFFGMGKKAEAPVLETSALVGNEQANVIAGGGEVGSSASPNLSEQTTEKIKEFIITGQNFSFKPSLITVKKGDRVKITFKNSQGFHDFVIDEFGVATPQAKFPATEVLEFTADKIGSFEYYCSVGTHRAMGMKGILKVE